MSIRKPIKADPDVLTAFEDVQEELDELATAAATITSLEQKVKDLTDRLDTPAVQPTFDKVPGDLHVDGNLRVDGAVDIRGDISAPGQIDGVMGAVPTFITGPSGTRIVQVNGSLTVLGAISAATVRTNELQLVETSDPDTVSVLASASPDTTNGTSASVIDVYTYTLPANTLNANGKGIEVDFSVVLAANGNTKNVWLYLGANGILLQNGANVSNTRMQGTLVRNSSTTVRYVISIIYSSAGTTTVGIGDLTVSDFAVDNDLVIKFQNASIDTADLTLKSVLVKLLPKAT